MNSTMADGARERLVAQIGEALFGQPGLTLMELAEKVKASRSNAAPLGYVRAEAIKALREDDEVTGVMVHVDERTDSVPVYLAARQPAPHDVPWQVASCAMAMLIQKGEIHNEVTVALAEAIAARQPVDPEHGHIDPNWSLHDRVEFALRDAGFDLDEAAFVAEAVGRACQPVGEPVAWMTHHDEPMLFPTAAEAAAYCEGDEHPVPLFRSPAQTVDLGDFKTLYQAYVRLLESGRDRINGLGGPCDPVNVMEANDLDLQAARRVIASKAVRNA